MVRKQFLAKLVLEVIFRLLVTATDQDLSRSTVKVFNQSPKYFLER